jgi:hypothetical protein
MKYGKYLGTREVNREQYQRKFVTTNFVIYRCIVHIESDKTYRTSAVIKWNTYLVYKLNGETRRNINRYGG